MRMIVEIGVHFILNNSKSAEKFWKELCMFTYRNRVLLPDFINHMGGMPHTHPIHETLKAAAPATWQLMDITHFWYFCRWFPNFFKKPEAYAYGKNCSL